MIACGICMTLPRPLSPFTRPTSFHLLNSWLCLIRRDAVSLGSHESESELKSDFERRMVFLPWLFGICTTQSLNSHGQVLTTTSTAKTKTTNYKLTLSELHFRRHKFYVRRHDRANKKNKAKSGSFWDVHSSNTLSKLFFYRYYQYFWFQFFQYIFMLFMFYHFYLINIILELILTKDII